MLLGENVHRTVEREYKMERTFTARARFGERFLLCFYDPCFLITSGQVRSFPSHMPTVHLMRLYDIFEYRHIALLGLQEH